MTERSDAMLLSQATHEICRKFNYAARTLDRKAAPTTIEMLDSVTKLIQLENEGRSLDICVRGDDKIRSFPGMKHYLAAAREEMTQWPQAVESLVHDNKPRTKRFDKAVQDFLVALGKLDNVAVTGVEYRDITLGVTMAYLIQTDLVQANALIGCPRTKDLHGVALDFPRYVR